MGGWVGRQVGVSQEISVLQFAIRAQKISPRKIAH